jgi:hypothetical protein
MLGALLFSPTVDTGYGSGAVYNLGALQYQELIFLAGAAFLVAGAVLYGFGELAERMERAGTAKGPEAASAAIAAADPSYQCGWCDRNMFPYRPCSGASEEKNRERAPRVTDPACVAQFGERGLLPRA